MIKQEIQYKTELENRYLNTDELLILRDIKTEQDRYFKPIDEDFF